MDVLAAARFQGPVLRAQGLAMASIVVVGAAVIAAIRIARDGGIDGLSIFWVILAVAAAVGVVTSEAVTNRRLARAAREQTSLGEGIVLFRVGQVKTTSDVTPPPLAGKGWISLGEQDLTVTAFRGRTTVAGHRREEILSAHVVARPKAYAVLVVAFADGSRFESIPVETGLRNSGLDPERASLLAADILTWKAQSLH